MQEDAVLRILITSAFLVFETDSSLPKRHTELPGNLGLNAGSFIV